MLDKGVKFMSKKCPNCGHEIQDGDTFCIHCGYKLAQNQKKEPMKNNDKSGSFQEHKNITKERGDSVASASMPDTSEPDNKCQVAFGPAPSGYHQIDVIYVQGPTINWISNNGDFPRAMGKAISTLLDTLQPDEFVCNLQFTTQNMGDTFAVNLAGDLYKKD